MPLEKPSILDFLIIKLKWLALTNWDLLLTILHIGARGKQTDRSLSKTGRSRAFFVILVCLTLKAVGKRLAYRLNVSVNTISRIWKTWLAFLYLQFKEIPIWPSIEIVNTYMPKCFKGA